MPKIDYRIRKDRKPLSISNKSEFDLIDTEEVLDDYYPYIKSSMNEENYSLQHDWCSVFKELIYENKVVGFVTYSTKSQERIMLNEYYIMPEFRENKALYKELIEILSFTHKFGILEPTRDLVELLIDYSLAKKVTEDIVVSGIDFYIDKFKTESDKRNYVFYEDNLFSNYYDLGICSTILFNTNEVIYHSLLENDLRKYGERKKLDNKYFKNVKELFSKNRKYYEQTIQELKNNASLLDDENQSQEITNEMDNNKDFSDKINKFIDMHNLEDKIELSLRNEKFLDPFSLYCVDEMMWEADNGKYKLDDTIYGKDYPISHDNYIYIVLKSLKHDKKLTFGLMAAEVKGLRTPYALKSLLQKQGFIDDEITYENWDEFAHESLTVNDLKDILRNNNLKVSGRKQELINRVAENQIPLDKFKSESPTVTPKGEEFLENNKWIEFYNKVLDNFDFNDFVKYLDTHEGKFLDVTYNYLEEHAKLAEKENDIEYLKDCGIWIQMFNLLGDKIKKNKPELDFYV